MRTYCAKTPSPSYYNALTVTRTDEVLLLYQLGMDGPYTDRSCYPNGSLAK